MVAVHVAHGRQLRTTCRRRCTSELCSSTTQDSRSEYARDERSGLLVLPSARCAATPQEELIRASTTGPAHSALSQHAVTLPASRFASHSIAPQAASASPGTSSAPSLVLPTSSEICPRAYARESDPCEKRRGFLVLPSASCSATPQRSRPKPPQPHMFAPDHASLLSFCQPRALHITSIASRTARACLGTVSAPFFWCFRTARNYAAGQAYWNEDGLISGQDSPIWRFA